MTAHFFLRAEVPDPGEREAFDRWKGGAVGSGIGSNSMPTEPTVQG
jgi:hypothetical protein